MLRNRTKVCENGTMNENLKFEMLSANIGQLTFSQPARRNALSAAMWEALPKLLSQAAKTQGLKVLIVTGDGDHFTAGADISEFETLYATEDSAAKISAHISAAMTALAEFPLPTLAMICGACAGGGCALALCCDIRFADNTAKFSVPPARLGLVYPYPDIQRLIEAVGVANAKDMIMSARLVKADEAKNMGLINFLHTPDELETAIISYAQSQAELSPHSLQTMKRLFNAYQAGQRGDNQQTINAFLSGFSSDDFKEGYSAFMDKRKPDFK